jgi:hypothetical protein
MKLLPNYYAAVLCELTCVINNVSGQDLWSGVAVFVGSINWACQSMNWQMEEMPGNSQWHIVSAAEMFDDHVPCQSSQCACNSEQHWKRLNCVSRSSIFPIFGRRFTKGRGNQHRFAPCLHRSGVPNATASGQVHHPPCRKNPAFHMVLCLI